MRRVCSFLSFLFLFACGKEVCREVPVDASPVELNIQRLDKELFSFRSAGEVEQFLESNAALSLKFLHSDQYPSNAILAKRMHALVMDPFIDTLRSETLEAFADTDDLVESLNTLYTYYVHYFPGSPVPELKTMITGLYNDLYIGDDLLVIGLDFFIGPQATYKPLNVPFYIQSRYTKRHLPAIIGKFLAGGKTPTGKSNTLLSEMIDYGKINFVVSRMLPCTPDSIIMGYTPTEMTGVRENREAIWAHFVENELLYETSEFTKQKYLGERPNIYEIGQKCPGRVGSWLGWEIVEEYVRRQNISLSELLQEQDHHKIFTSSGYKPKND